MWIYWAAFAVMMAWVFGASVIWALDVFPTHAENAISVVTLGIICIIEAIALSITTRRHWEDRPENRHHTSNSQRPPNEPKDKGSAIDALRAQPETHEENHHAAEEYFWNKQIKSRLGAQRNYCGSSGLGCIYPVLYPRGLDRGPHCDSRSQQSLDFPGPSRFFRTAHRRDANSCKA